MYYKQTLNPAQSISFSNFNKKNQIKLVNLFAWRGGGSVVSLLT